MVVYPKEGDPTIHETLAHHRARLHRCKGVVSTGIGFRQVAGKSIGQLGIVCRVREKLSLIELAHRDRIPAVLDEGVRTDVVQAGTVRLFQTSPKERHRPAPGGVSIGHVDVTAGTLGCLVRRNGVSYILSNNHVLANLNQGQIGDPIVQPGTADGGMFPGDHIANLSDYVPIGDVESTCPLANRLARWANWTAGKLGYRTRLRAVRAPASTVDCAIAKPVSRLDVDNAIFGTGHIVGQESASVAMRVQKSGRTTGVTVGHVSEVDVDVVVDMGGGHRVVFTDQVVVAGSGFSAPGDSGSAILTTDGRIVGLLFAGSSNTTVFNRIENVFSALGVTL
jgi:hypothetical protein